MNERRKTPTRKVALLYEDITYKIIGASMEVHKTLGQGFLEAVYEEALGYEFEEQCLHFENQKELEICYKGRTLKKKYKADYIVENKIVVEIKATSSLTSETESQMLNYLKATGFKLGVLLNFGADSLEWKRIIK